MPINTGYKLSFTSTSFRFKSRRPNRARGLLPAWLLVGLLLTTGGGLALNTNPLFESGPAYYEVGRLLPEGPGLYRLALCSDQTKQFPLSGENLTVGDPTSLDPAIGGLELVNNSLLVSARLPGQTVLSFVASKVNTTGAPLSNQTLRIHLNVGLCTPQGQQIDPAVQEFLNQTLAATPGLAGRLVSNEEAPNSYSLIACQGSRYSYLFDAQTQVRNGASADPAVASLVLYNPPGRLMVYATGQGTTTLSFEADELDFPWNIEEWQTFTIEITAVSCAALDSATETTSQTLELEPGSTPTAEEQAEDFAFESGQSSQTSQTTSNDSDNQNLASSVSLSGGGSVAVSQALNVNSASVSGDADESLGTTSDDGTSFAAHIELNPGDSSTIFVGVSNQGQGDIAYNLNLAGAKGVTVSATPSGSITGLTQTGFYSWKFILPGGASGANTGVKLTVAIPDNASPGFYSIGTVKLTPSNV